MCKVCTSFVDITAEFADLGGDYIDCNHGNNGWDVEQAPCIRACSVAV